jgi:hypothetical protein
MDPEYEILRLNEDFDPGDEAVRWELIPALIIKDYLWLDNGYKPRVEARAGFSEHYLYVHFKAFEKRVRVRHMGFQDPVYTDSCVELFIDPFPEKGLGYINFETNAAGALLAGFGKGRHERKRLPPEDLAGFRIVASIHGLIDGPHGADFWTVRYRIPLMLFKNYYGETIRPGLEGRANFYKCGDETEFPHYGAWSPPRTKKPDFHRPEFFGKIIFSESSLSLKT